MEDPNKNHISGSDNNIILVKLRGDEFRKQSGKSDLSSHTPKIKPLDLNQNRSRNFDRSRSYTKKQEESTMTKSGLIEQKTPLIKKQMVNSQSSHFKHGSFGDNQSSGHLLGDLKQRNTMSKIFNVEPQKNEISLHDRKLIRRATVGRILSDNQSHRDQLQAQFLKEGLFPVLTTNVLKPSINQATQSSSSTQKGPKLSLQKLISLSPYHGISKKVKYSITNKKEINKFLKPQLRNSISYNGNQVKHTQGTTIYLKKKVGKESLLQRLHSLGDTTFFRHAIKWKTIKWLWINKYLVIENLLRCYKDFQSILNDRDSKLNKKALEEYMRILKLEKDMGFIEDLFLLFDEKKTGLVNFKEVLCAFIITSKSSYVEKMNMLIDLVEHLSSGIVPLTELISILKLIVFNKKDLKKLQDIVKSAIADPKDVENVPKSQVMNFLLTNEAIKSLIIRNGINLSEIDTLYEEEMMNIVASNLRNSKHNSMQDTKIMCSSDVDKFDRILYIRNQTLLDKKKNKQMESFDNTSSEEENK